jgi:DNA invertase Pin-like site-specific DNA recombinase
MAFINELQKLPAEVPRRLRPDQHLAARPHAPTPGIEDRALRLDFSDAASGKSMSGGPELEAALATLAPGYELVVAEWDRATRSMWGGLEIIKMMIEAGVTIACSIAAISTWKPRSTEASRCPARPAEQAD